MKLKTKMYFYIKNIVFVVDFKCFVSYRHILSKRQINLLGQHNFSVTVQNMVTKLMKLLFR